MVELQELREKKVLEVGVYIYIYTCVCVCEEKTTRMNEIYTD